MVNETNTPKKSTRIASIDALRGFDMFWIIGGDSMFIALFTLIGTPFFQKLGLQLEHCDWQGFRFYDLIFPLFLFITGLSMPFSITRRLERGDSKKAIYQHIIVRTVLLFILGLVYNGLFDLDFIHQRYPGVLQRIAICYLFASIIIMNNKVKGIAIWSAALLLIYWLILLLIPSPGFNAYNLTKEGNLAGYIDRLLIPGSFCCYPQGDNEGILSTIPAICNVLFGYMAGMWLKSENKNNRKVVMLLISGIASLAIGWLWGLIFPVIKILWTSSYVLISVGWSLILISLFYWIIDIKGYKKWAFPFIIIGLNPITIYVIQGIFDFGVIANIFIHGFINKLGNFNMLFAALCIFTVKWLFLYFLYQKKIFLKV